MSANFSLLTWLARLPLAASCIDGDGRHSDRFNRDMDDFWEPRYYALAEDWKGSHCPYPKLPEWARRIFDARVQVAYWATDRFHRWAWKLPADRQFIRRVAWKHATMNWAFDRFFATRRRGYSWHFHCSLCGGLSFFDLAGSRWACNKCGRRNPAVPERRPRFSLLEALERWGKLCAKIDKRPKWVCCRWCGQAGHARRWDGFALQPTDILETIITDLPGRTSRREYECFRCWEPAGKIRDYIQHRKGGYTNAEVVPYMRFWQRTGTLPKAIEQYWEAVCPF